MAVNLNPPEDLLPIPGIRVGTAEAAIKRPGRDDLALFELAPGSHTAAVFTRNAFAAAPVVVAREHWSEAEPRALLVNSGNANAGTGARGLADARESCEAVARALGVTADAVLPFSTGVIGQPLPMDRLGAAVPRAVADLRDDGWLDAAHAIMTTDTVSKAASRRVGLDDGEVTLTGIAKGSGMIRPDMATMLAFVATDAAIERSDLQAALSAAVRDSFNSITVDGDTSTNDACLAVATGQGRALGPDDAGWARFTAALTDLCTELAQAIVRDAEGATRFITIEVAGARDEAEARAVGFTVAHSPLVKTAAFAGDPNWGRILAAVGRAGLDDLDIAGVDIALDDVAIVRGGEPAGEYREADGAAVMARSEFAIRIDLGRGSARARIWTSDLSYEYVKINAEYRT
ncbi:glutamate N-acetyltransferase / N-acetylglutamate synthase [Salinisphaera sp. PC39]|uniref:bifunctional glutamate N-acetyltransferase/amino-acid acetyltransferase ArgJ n=1 Tax=Salinisphaera sp. PC39 TaxID=1304156 RepID=UPI00333F9201